MDSDTSISISNPPPEPVGRPALALWLWRRDLDLRAAGVAFGCSPEQVRLICLPFADPRRRVPTTGLLERIAAYTGGVIRPAHFYPPELSGEAIPSEGQA